MAIASSMVSEHVLLAPHPDVPPAEERPASLELEGNLGRLEGRLIQKSYHHMIGLQYGDEA